MTDDGRTALRRNLNVATRVDADLLSPFSRKEADQLLTLLRTLASSTQSSLG
jgi:DNA-binding MarR family transcriptional regulator